MEKEREYVEAVPGPAIVLSKEEAKRVRESKADPKVMERIKENARIIGSRIKNETVLSQEELADEIVETFKKKFESMTYEEREEYLKENGFSFGEPEDEKTC